MRDLFRIVSALLLTALIAPASALAQEPQTEAGALAAAIAIVRSRPGITDSIPIVTDTTALYAALRPCHDGPGGKPVCTFADSRKLVPMVIVHLITPTSATVELRYYYVLRGSCPLNTPFSAPVVAFTRSDHFTIDYLNGHWQTTGGGRGIEC